MTPLPGELYNLPVKYTKLHAKMETDIASHLETLYRLVVDGKAQTVVELGVGEGESTIALLEGVYATKGHLVSVDTELCEEARIRMRAYELAGRWTFSRGDDVLFGQQWPKKKPIDLVFVDTSHEWDHPTRELEVWEPLVRPGGIMVFHETVTFMEEVWEPIKKYMEARTEYTWENYAHSHGLGILRKPL